MLNYSNIGKVDTTNKIWDDLYMVRIPFGISRSVQELQHFGIRITGIKEIDKGMRNELITTMISIARMVELYEDGVPIRVPNVSDTRLIYEAITEHLTAWKEYMKRGININNFPLNDLILMDKFAHEVYEFAKFEFMDDELNSAVNSFFKQVSPITADNLFKKDPFKDVTNASQIERESMAPFFSKTMPGIRRY